MAPVLWTFEFHLRNITRWSMEDSAIRSPTSLNPSSKLSKPLCASVLLSVEWE